MKFIKVGKNYMIKNSNGRIVSEKEKLELENRELIIEDIKSNKCQGKTTQKISKNKKRIKKIMEEDKKKKIEPLETYDEEDIKETVKINIDVQPLDNKKIVKYIKEQTAPVKEDDADEIIKEADTII
jgi:hypothetical protein